MAEFEKTNTRGIAIGGLVTGIIGTSLGALMTAGNLGVGNARNAQPCERSAHPNFEGPMVNRYELALQSEIEALRTEVKLRDANAFTMGEMGKLRDYVDSRFSSVERELCDQRVYNATNIATVNCISGQVAQLMALTKLVVPNSSICPGWGAVTVTTTPAATT